MEPLAPLRLVAPLVALLAVAGCAVGVRTPHPGGVAGEEKVLLCHKGRQTLEVAEPAVEAHLGHGDTLGPCR